MGATKNGFTRFDTIKEFEDYIESLKITRTINGLQVHHMALPDYDCFYKTNGKTEDELTRTVNLNSYGVSKGWGCIAQHFNIFPNGKITTGRDINKTPVGITGWNTNKICIEIYGNFDKNQDIMTEEQKKTVIAVYGLLCKKLNLTPNTSTIRPHAWYESDGDYIGTYIPGKSRKTCPGTNFMGIGNTKEAFVKYFYPWIKEYMNNGSTNTGSSSSNTSAISISDVNMTGYVSTLEGDNLNVRKGCNTTYSIIGSLANNSKIDIVGRASNGWLKIKYKSGYGYVNGKYVVNIQNVTTNNTGKYIVRYLQQSLNTSYKLGLAVDGLYGPKTKNAVKSHFLKIGHRGEHVVWLQKALINRGYKINADGIFGNATLEAVKKYQKSRGLKVDGYAGLDTHNAIVND